MHTSLPYRLERTRNKHSRAVFQRDGSVVIRLAKNLSKRDEQIHVEYLLKRIPRIVLREQRRTMIDPFRPLLQGEPAVEVSLTTGQTHLFELRPGDRTRAKRTATGWTIDVGPKTQKPALHRLLWKLLSDLEQKRITELVHQINVDTFNVRLGAIRLRYVTSQWGSCSLRHDILLNTLLLFLPPELLYYVIIHELAHCIVASHSPRYWRQVERFLPEYAALRRRLRGYRLWTL